MKYLAGFICLTLSLASPEIAMAGENSAGSSATANVPLELTFQAARDFADPFNQVRLDVVFTEPDGTAREVPAFWAGGKTWKARYASPRIGWHSWRSACNVTEDVGLHGVTGRFEIAAYRGDNPLFVHGPIRVAADKRHFEHADGMPFFWLGDTWWMGLCHRLHWPDEFQQLAADRKKKGFNVIQIVAGLYPDMEPFDPRGANEAGFPWEKDHARLRPEYFDAVDQRLGYLVEQGFTPCIVGAWGYFEKFMGVEKAKQHWRNLVARYGASPVVWCVAGEANLPYYLAKDFPYDDREQVKGWTEVASYLRQTDPFHRPMTIHPTGIGRLSSRNAINDIALLDFDMLQTPHGQREAVPPTVRTMRESYADRPVMPVINGEAAYEKLGDNLPTEWTRAMFWLCMTNGAAGHTYGANGIWQVNRKGQPHGPSPHHPPGSQGYGAIPWDEAMHLPGSQQMAEGKKFFESLPWTRLVPFPDTVEWVDRSRPLGDWIWFPEGDPKFDAPREARFFRRVFDVPNPAMVLGATLHITADDRFTVWLNGQKLGQGNEWAQPKAFAAERLLKPGRNVLAVAAENVEAPRVRNNPASLNAALTINFADGSRTEVRTDATWRVSTSEATGWREAVFDDSTWQTALVTAKVGAAPWGEISAAGLPFPPQACGIGDELRVVYGLVPGEVVVHGLRSEANYRATFFNPLNGQRTAPLEIRSNAKGDCRVPPAAHDHDWVLLLEMR